MLSLGQYISVSTPADEIYKQNDALVSILSFLGKKYKATHDGFFVKRRDDDRVGLDFINRKCGKKCKKTIKNLMHSAQEKTANGTACQCWMIHKCKAERFFRILYNVLKELKAEAEIWALFDELYNGISRNFPIEKRGSQIIPYPYKSALNQVQYNPRYTHEEKKSIARIVVTFPAYDKLYRVKKKVEL